ncbi:MAG: ABC transporter permease [Clostridia bacterium]|nr:ABC transporter permease [Clostridia bacterium]NLV34453.1 ABC transporter permease [Clostridiaceae bacterium]HPB16909.1 ABC transporter permease [Clostridia bacterium]HQM97267.1 ABC transporter permease [Clostridia bacterium]
MSKRRFSFPYLIWMSIFIVVPLLLIIFYAFTDNSSGKTVFTLEHLKAIFEPLYLKVIGRSLYMSLIATVVCFILGYPAAMILASKDFAKKSTMLILIVLPMWMNFLLRTYSWLSLLENEGLINRFLTSIGFEQVQLMYNNFAVVLGMVYNFLPFMILPIYSVLVKIDKSVIEAAKDLGANSAKVFGRVIFPLSIPGVISGITMTFMPALSTFVISRLLSGGKITLIGNIIEQQFTITGDWGLGSALSLLLMVLIFVSMIFINKYGDESVGAGGLL